MRIITILTVLFLCLFMTDSGALIKNAALGVMIDGKYRNLCKDQSVDGQSISNPNTTGMSSVWFTEIAITASSLVPLMLLRPNTDRFIAPISYERDASNNYEGVRVTTEPNQTTSIDWICCRENRQQSADTYGMRVWNENQELVFDAGNEYFKIHSVHTINLSDPSGETYPGDGLGGYSDITHSAVSNPYYIITPLPYWWFNDYVSAEYKTYMSTWTVGMKKISPTTVRVGWFRYQFNGITGPHFKNGQNGGNNPTLKLLVCSL